MAKAPKNRAYYEKLAEQFFPKSRGKLPPVEDLVVALEIAKGTKFRLSPPEVERLRQAFAQPQGKRNDDWCVFCDDGHDGDKCSPNGCDALDCFPGLTPDS